MCAPGSWQPRTWDAEERGAVVAGCSAVLEGGGPAAGWAPAAAAAPTASTGGHSPSAHSPLYCTTPVIHGLLSLCMSRTALAQLHPCLHHQRSTVCCMLARRTREYGRPFTEGFSTWVCVGV